MMKWLVGYGVAALVFLVLDIAWLSYAMPSVYGPEIGGLLADEVFMPAAVAFYLIYVAGMLVIAAEPGSRAGSIASAAMTGAVLGCVAYGTYDLTNLATLKSWSVKVTLMDMAWGTFVTCVSSAASCAAMIAISGRRGDAH